MATNGMTIDGLNTVTSITAQDKVPVWDNEATGEPTRKITGQNLANSVKSLASLPNTTEMNTAIEQSTAKLLGEVNVASTERTITVDLSPYNVLICVYCKWWDRFPIGTIIIPLWSVRSYHGQADNMDTWKILDPLDSTKYATITYVSDSSVSLLTNDQGTKYVTLIGLP